jgi:predicted phosphodiesterase
VFSDVHGNAPALRKILQEVRGQVGAYVCLGDTVGYGPDNDECLEMVAALPDVTILAGNHEEMFVSGDLRYCSSLAREFYAISRRFFVRADLLPSALETRISGWLFTHTFRAGDRWIYVHDEAAVPAGVPGDCCIGHTHRQKSFLVGGCKIVNCGSVGQNRDNPAEAAYAVFDTESGSLELRTTPYDLKSFVDSMAAKGYPDHLLAYYTRAPRIVTASPGEGPA